MALSLPENRQRTHFFPRQQDHKGITDPKDREGQFWKRRLQTGDVAVAKLAEFLETGRIAEQFDLRISAKQGADVFSPLREDNPWVCRSYAHLVKNGKSLAKAASSGRGFDIEETECVGKGFNVEEME